ncbi:MAG: dienelactone hydrolase family protein [Myxococcales bacterium]|nr:dienelactone hydrolase family protein [Myxococcales bacterium]
MCDDTTEDENERYLAKIGRREFSVGAGAVAAALVTGCGVPAPGRPPAAAAPPGPEPAPTPTPPATEPKSEPAATTDLELTQRKVTITTPDGKAEGFFVTPKEGKHPGVIVWPDVAGLREAFEKMATGLARDGYAVLVVNPYYRSSALPILKDFAEWRTEEGKAKIAPMREALTPEAITKDGAAFVKWLDEQPEVETARKLATTGYCMGGPFTFRTAAAAPKRVGVIGSFHGGGLVTKEPSSPHKLFAKMKAAALICIAHNDDEREPDAKTKLKDAAAAAKLPVEIEVYPAQHGWCAIDSPVYDEAQAERAHRRLLALLQEHL